MEGPSWFTRHAALALVLVNLVMLAIAEAGLRLILGADKRPPESAYVVPDTLTHHDYRPGVTFVTRPSGADHFPPAENSINALGLRGPLPGAKTRTRVLLVGDSFVQADEVLWEQTLTARLNQRLGARFEFLAHGIPSWAPTTEFSWIYHRGLALRPDRVVLFLCVNDFFRDGAFHDTDAIYRRQAVYQGVVPVRYRLPQPGVVVGVLQRSALYQLLRSGLHRWRDWRDATRPADNDSRPTIRGEIAWFSRSAADWPTDLRDNVDQTTTVVVSLYQYLDDRGVAMSACLVPSGFAWADEVRAGKEHPLYRWAADSCVSQQGLEGYLRQHCRNAGITWIDLQAAFEQAKAASPELLFNPLEGHWTAAGHAAAAAALEAFLVGPPTTRGTPSPPSP
jgi:hypothetical protein